MSKNSQTNLNKISLDNIKFPYDLRQLDVESLMHIAEEIRKEMIESVRETDTIWAIREGYKNPNPIPVFIFHPE